MRRGWRHFGLFVAAVAMVVLIVLFATEGEEPTTGLVVAQVVFIAGLSYLITFVVWPRKSPISSAHPSVRTARTAVPNEPSPQTDKRPVLVIGNRPAGSAPGSRVHIRDAPTSRSTRGRRPGERQPTGDLRWPVQH